MRALQGRVAVVTGAARGIGAAIARRLAAEGMRVALVDRAADGVSELAGELAGASAHAADVADRAAWPRLVEQVLGAHGQVDLLVNNAGVTVVGPFERQSAEDIERVLNVNLGGVLLGTRAFLPALRARPQAHVVNVASLAGMVPFPYQTTYCASKFGVRAFSAALRMELAGSDVGVSTILPGSVATRLLETATSYDGPASRKLAELMLAHGVPPAHVAERVVRAIRRNQAEVIVGWDAQLLATLRATAPRALSAALGASYRFRARGSGER